MRFDKLTASFGRLSQQTLLPGPGLNIIEAPNESGKSTWCAFLRTILYGLPTRERGALADKNRYAPWDGTPMQGTLELFDGERHITIRRDTARVNSPMGRFSAVFTGTAEPVPELSGDNCGETLLGIPREVFERSVFIRQTGLAVDQSPELERRIAALLSTGEEQSSFSEVYDALKKELNRRRHNRTGLLPALENEIAELETLLQQSDLLQTRLEENEARSTALSLRAAALQEELRRHELAARAARWAQREDARLAAETAAAKSSALQAAICRDGLPGEDALHQLAARLDSLQATEGRADELSHSLALSRKTAEETHARHAAHRFYPLTPAQAADAPLQTPPQPRFPLAALILLPIAGAALAGALLYLSQNLWLSIGLGLVFTGLSLLAAGILNGKKRRRWEDALIQLRQAQDEELRRYTILYEEAETAKQHFEQLAAEESALAASRRTDLSAILKATALFAPVATAAEAERAVQDALARRKEAQDAETLAQAAKLRYDVLCEHSPDLIEPETEFTPPTSDQSALLHEASEVNAAIANQREERSRLEGECSALGRHSELVEKRDELEQRRTQLQHEYHVIALAMETLNDANAELQSHFSPALGQEAGRIFSALTDGKYAHVLLDRTLSASAASADGTPRSAAILSQGCADQLYLALRLAISRMVLPAEKQIPLILDDALTSFDDARLARALDWLIEESKQRQILLFTCQSRERSYLAGNKNVTFLHL
ncbi:MAG: AAA family ATPase [Oscillospiraceae bacterium]|nr:AAA family ATPase [Oscillospiraceae bacterium]